MKRTYLPGNSNGFIMLEALIALFLCMLLLSVLAASSMARQHLSRTVDLNLNNLIQERNRVHEGNYGT